MDLFKTSPLRAAIKAFEHIFSITVYLDINARHGKDLQRWIFLGCEAEELALSLVPLHRVERVAFQVILTD